mmetsp:Transcript_67817/g.201807  ORF Transcript_67817/g.201807 Transcript_67817/m.201807 type:complete len:607 (+) Transcript_67817:1101-2921(+)
MVDEPRNCPRQRQILAPADHVAVPRRILEASSNALNGQRSHSAHCNQPALGFSVAELVSECVPDVPTEHLLALVGLLARHGEAPGEHHDGRGEKGGLLRTSTLAAALPWRGLLRRRAVAWVLPAAAPCPLAGLGLLRASLLELEVEALEHLLVCQRQLVVLRVRIAVALPLFQHLQSGHLLDLHARHVRLQLGVRQNPELRRRGLEVAEQLLARRPGRQARGHGVSLAERQVVRAELRLQPGGAARQPEPSLAADPVQPVEEHEVVGPLPQALQRLTQPQVPGANDREGVLVGLPLALPAGDALDQEPGGHDVGGQQPADERALPHEELEVLVAPAQHLPQGLLQLQDLAAPHGQQHHLVRVYDGQLRPHPVQAGVAGYRPADGHRRLPGHGDAEGRRACRGRLGLRHGEGGLWLPALQEDQAFLFPRRLGELPAGRRAVGSRRHLREAERGLQAMPGGLLRRALASDQRRPVLGHHAIVGLIDQIPHVVGGPAELAAQLLHVLVAPAGRAGLVGAGRPAIARQLRLVREPLEGLGDFGCQLRERLCLGLGLPEPLDCRRAGRQHLTQPRVELCLDRLDMIRQGLNVIKYALSTPSCLLLLTLKAG